MSSISAWSRLQRWAQRILPWHMGDAGADIPDALWQAVWQRLPFLHRLSATEAAQLRHLAALFLRQKEFHGGHGLTITDQMALDIALQACLPLMHWGPRALDWYGDFVVIVVHPDEVLARRELVDGAGVVHQVQDTLAGEAMAGGPVMLAWSHVARADTDALRGHNLVIHEFAHKLDMRHKPLGSDADGCPRLPPGFMGLPARAAQAHWHTQLHQAYQQHRQAVAMHQRFGAEAPWLDAYGATAPAEFFAVACEAFFVHREQLAQAHPALCHMLQAFFQPATTRLNA